MHKRKKYLVYPPGYSPLVGNYKVRNSRYQALKLAEKFGLGSVVDVAIYYHQAARSKWVGVSGREVFVIGEAFRTNSAQIPHSTT